MFQRQLELSQTREEVQQSTQSAFTPVRSQGEYAFTPVRLQGKCCARVLFVQDSQTQNPRQDSGRLLSESR